MSGRLLLALGLCAHLLFALGPAWEKVSTTKSGRDFASYYYAVQVAADGGDPYDNGALAAKAKKDRTRSDVHPYFYPPPFLLTMGWALPFSLPTAYKGMLLLNELLLFGCVGAALCWYRVAPWAAAAVLGLYSPIPDNAWMGQANLLALLPMLVGLAVAERRPWLGGVLVGFAAMLKMSPALFLVYWAMRGRWKAVAAAVVTAVASTLVTLPLVGVPEQLRFYTEVLPGFSSGDYHGLSVPITLPANHSVADLWNTLWPGPSKFRLSPAAQHATLATMLALLGAWAWRFRRSSGTEPDPAAVGALTVIMVVTPVYTYEHHLVFLMLAVMAMLTLRPGVAAILVAFFLGWPLEWLRAVQARLPDALGPVMRESKFVAEMALFAMLMLPRRARG